MLMMPPSFTSERSGWQKDWVVKRTGQGRMNRVTEIGFSFMYGERYY